MTPAHLAVAVGIAVLVVAGVAFAGALRWQRWRTSVQSGRRARRGHAGQLKAHRLLEQSGFAVVDASPRVSWTTLQDGEPCVVELRADYLVSRRGQLFVAEVKTGEAADTLTNSATRRQLLEYQLAFGVTGVLLVCPERRAIHRIEFAALARPRPARWDLALVALVALGAGAALGVVSTQAPRGAPPAQGAVKPATR
ncbi:MAG: hypothetical protein IPI49_10945 [Myxococcales bacterium]|nr:hypothetical protein [Myxococcales bacterium]